jgi:3',5'-cyclic AMP phosphodiesterase CpdA
MITRIAHLADLHFERVDPAVVEALEGELRADPPDLIAVSGDLTMAARHREFATARAFLDRLGAPTLAVPGNHDVSPYRVWERVLDPWRPWRRFISPETEPCWSNGRVAVVGLNSARAIGYTLDWSEGRLNRWQIERAARSFSRFPETAFRIVVSHHPFAVPPSLIGSDVVGRAGMAIRRLAALRVRLVLTGHLHVGALHDIATGAVEQGAVPPPLFVLGSSATSTRLRGEANAYHVLRIAADGFAIERRVWTGQGFAVET